ncbi:hypothetical protein [Gymnodinialimonas sp. 57CJ19]|uniref:hypothetical protein n=1 Tax=Gymnodinialimonas sp. 57CJ19 TaxID=3138498 RepID=UPI0031344B09
MFGSEAASVTQGKVSNWITGLAVIVAIAGIVATVLLYKNTVAIQARISSYTASSVDGNLVLSGGGPEFIQPDYITVRPIWAPSDLIAPSQINGTAIVFPSGVIDASTNTITYERILDRVCGYDDLQRCEHANPVLLEVSISLLGSFIDVDPVPVR